MFTVPPVKTDGLDTFKPKRILFCQLRQIGDVVLSTPYIRILKRLWPDADIDVYTEKKCTPVLENNPDVANVIAVDKKLGFFKTLAFYRHVGRGAGRGRYDMVVDCQQLPRITWMLLFSNAPVRFTYTPKWYNRFLYTHWNIIRFPYAAKCKASPALFTWGEDLWDDPRPKMHLSEAEKAWAVEHLSSLGLKKGETLVTVDPTHRRESRRWPAKHYGKLLRLAAEARPDLRFYLLYGPGEEEDARAVIEQSGIAERCLLPSEVTTLRQMAAVIGAADFHIGNCSSPRHFAAALDTPTLTVLGSTSDAWTCPTDDHSQMILGLPCQPCTQNVCPEGHYRCLTDMRPEMVLQEFLQRLPAANNS